MILLLLLIFLPYFFLLLPIFFGLRKIKPFHRGSDPGLFISVVIACRNEEEDLPFLLSDIASQNYDQDNFELLIVDDNSTDATFNVASAFAGIKNMQVLKNRGSGKKIALRTGIEGARGSLIVTSDADCRAGRNWLWSLASFYSLNDPEMVICPVNINPGRGFFHRFQELEFLSLQGITAGTAAAGDPVMCNGANLSFRKEAYLRNSGNLHDELISGDDIFLLHSLKRKEGNRIFWIESQEAAVTTGHSGSIRSFLSQRARWISKSPRYTDRLTILLGLVTFVTVLALAAILITGFFIGKLLPVYLVALIIKSVPDFLILSNSALRYGNKKIMRWFLPSQLIYPFYIIAAVVFSFAAGRRNQPNYPSPTGI